MHIGLVTGSFLPYVGGVEWKVHYLASEYTARGHDVRVFAPGVQRSSRNTPMPVQFQYELIRAGRQARGFGFLRIIDFLMRSALIQAHRQRPFDVLHCHHLGTPTRWGVFMRRRFGVPVVSTTCGEDVFKIPELNYGIRMNARQDRIVRDNAKSVDVIGCISRGVREEVESLQPSARLENIPNGVPWEQFQVGSSSLIRDQLGLSSDDLIVLTVGRNITCKRFDLGIQAFARIAAQVPRAHYAIIGRDLEGLAPAIRQLGMEGRIHLIGEIHISKVAWAMRSADVFFNPSMCEGFSQVNAQALACGLPLVITDGVGNVDAGDYGAALIARCNDVDSMARTLQTMLEDRQLRERLAAEAAPAGTHYAWSRIAEQYLQIFEDLVKKK